MLQVPLTLGEHLVVDSNWDSGRHCNIVANVVDETYNNKSLDQVLTKDEIKCLEAVLASQILKFLDKKK